MRDLANGKSLFERLVCSGGRVWPKPCGKLVIEGAADELRAEIARDPDSIKAFVASLIRPDLLPPDAPALPDWKAYVVAECKQMPKWCEERMIDLLVEGELAGADYWSECVPVALAQIRLLLANAQRGAAT